MTKKKLPEATVNINPQLDFETPQTSQPDETQLTPTSKKKQKMSK